MRTEDAKRSVERLAETYNNLRTLHMNTGDTRFYHQAEGIDLAVKTLGLDATSFIQLTLPDFADKAVEDGKPYRWR